MTTQTPPKLWLRSETKEFEKRAALTPATTKALLDRGFDVTVERDPQRIFDDEEYERVGAKLAPHSSWPTAPKDTLIVGLKELPVEDTPLEHTHIQFAHCYKQQAGWADVLKRFADGNGSLYDLEFLTDDSGRRVAAFGFHAGFAGAAVGLLAHIAQQEGKELGHLEPYPNEDELIKDLKQKIQSAKSDKPVKALVIGALGRCGRGAVSLFQKAGLADENIIKWDMNETAKGGPFKEILDVDIFVNCIYLSSKIPNFIDRQFIEASGNDRRLSTVVDVSCDTTNPNNPIPIYNVNTTFDKPTVPVELKEGLAPMQVVSIDHLPTLLPRESSDAFSHDLLPSLFELTNRESARVWTEAKDLFVKFKSQALESLKA
ncbi:Formate/glycerate dehydrogenase catalytic domain-like protein [Wallemia mellicola]|nr:Formate/glycerate dehydrogenase catalytic domain-like protein [Wallemia mellicola]TIC75580.1 Formate/glycerate dehydrogenase catalytic domain-like protein [Wallemia mellicola]